MERITKSQLGFLRALVTYLPSAQRILTEAQVTVSMIREISKSRAQRIIGDIVAGMAVFGGRVLTKENIAADFLRHNRGDKDATYRAMLPLLGVTDKLTFYRNLGGGSQREPKSLPEQREELRKLIARVFNSRPLSFWLGLAQAEGNAQGNAQAAEENAQAAEENAQAAEGTVEIIVGDTFQAEPESPYTLLYQHVMRARSFAQSRGETFESLDSMRILIDGFKAIRAGATVDALMASLTLTWNADTRAQFGAYYYPGEYVPDDKGFDYSQSHPVAEVGYHKNSGYVCALVKAGIPVWLYGPAGTGKSTAARYAAEILEKEYFEVNLSGAMVSSLKGKDRLKEFIETAFCESYERNAIITLEEFDSSMPNVATFANNAIASNELWNDANGRVYKKNPGWGVIATGNTPGTGASATFTARTVIDGATRDRFRMGLVYMPLDLTLERHILTKQVGEF